MKNLYFFLLVTLSLAVVAQPPKGKAKPGSNYGAKITKDNVHPVEELGDMLNAKDTVSMKVRVQVEDVCSSKGCWFTFKLPDGQTAMVKMKDYGFFVPVDLKGKTAIVDGKSFMKTTSVDDLKHYAEDAKKPQSEIDAITQPKREVRFVANGVLVE